MEFSRRKWGYYLTLLSGKRFKVKLLYFRKGASCSMQRHFKRKELWLLIFGHGYLKVSGKAQTLRKGDYGLVPLKAWHQFKAKRSSLVLEIQTGYCREDDIERR